MHNGELLAVVEYKSQASSFSNNLNNRAEEAIGNNTDLLQAYEDGVFEPSPAPWIGYLMLMADNEKSRKVVYRIPTRQLFPILALQQSLHRRINRNLDLLT